ncbi:PrsW family glutamic-type intramembrane protease [Actinoallomurus sp. NPDC052308]|uniref:PrsW family glutamic-type intramembrane protease n=1 Tax=Actinoallomurus sp. NPDC052308 TaxID=3155530 RepID=UPI00344AA4F2
MIAAPPATARAPKVVLLARIRDDVQARARALLVARLMIAVYLLELLLNLTRPHVMPGEPALSIFMEMPKTTGRILKESLNNNGLYDGYNRMMATPRLIFWAVLAGIVIGVLVQVFGTITRAEGRRAVALTWVTLTAVIGPFSLLTFSTLLSYPLVALACVPATAAALTLLHFCQRFARLPLSTLLAAFGWGALIVYGAGRVYTGLGITTVYGYMFKGYLNADGTIADQRSLTDLNAVWGSIAKFYRITDLMAVHWGVANALVVAAGVVLALLLLRHRVTDALTGLIIGAAIGLGDNFVESTVFIKVYGSFGSSLGSTFGFEFWLRQVVTLFGGTVAWGALLGAGFGLAAQMRRGGLPGPPAARRRLVVATSFATAIGGAASYEILASWLSHLTADSVDAGTTFDTLVVSPGLWLLPQSPFIFLAVLMLIAGRRARASAAYAAVSAEAAAGGAISPPEVPFLADPALRWWAVVNTWRWYGRAAAVALLRLQSAQLDLAGWRFERQQADPGETPADREEGDRLRAKVLRLKAGAAPIRTAAAS